MARWPLVAAPTRTISALRTSGSTNNPCPTLVTGLTAHTKGSWVELIASTSGDTNFMNIFVCDTFVSGSATNMFLDIGVGAALSEVVVVPDLLCGYLDPNTGSGVPMNFMVPLDIPSGSRVAARVQGLIVNDTARVGVDLYGGSPWCGVPPGPAVTAYGIVSGTTKGTLVTAGAVNVKGNWSDITTSTTRRHTALGILMQPNNRIVTASDTWLVDVGLWNGSSYDVVWPDVVMRYSAAETIVYTSRPTVCPLGFSLPIGSRLGVRGSCTTASLTLDVALYGIG